MGLLNELFHSRFFCLSPQKAPKGQKVKSQAWLREQIKFVRKYKSTSSVNAGFPSILKYQGINQLRLDSYRLRQPIFSPFRTELAECCHGKSRAKVRGVLVSNSLPIRFFNRVIVRQSNAKVSSISAAAFGPSQSIAPTTRQTSLPVAS